MGTKTGRTWPAPCVFHTARLHYTRFDVTQLQDQTNLPIKTKPIRTVRQAGNNPILEVVQIFISIQPLGHRAPSFATRVLLKFSGVEVTRPSSLAAFRALRQLKLDGWKSPEQQCLQTLNRK